MLAHAMERYFTTEENCEAMDYMLEGLMRNILKYGRRVMIYPNDIHVRSELMLSAMWAHNSMLSMGRGSEWVSHYLEHELSAFHDIAHGAGLAIVFPAWMKFVYKRHPKRFVRFFKEVFELSLNETDDDTYILKGITELENFYRSLGLPIRLNEIGINERLIEQYVKGYLIHKPKEIMGEIQVIDEFEAHQIFNLAL